MKKIINYLNKNSLFGYFMHNTLKTLILIFIITFVILQFFEPYLLAHMPLKNQIIINLGSSILACASFAISFLIYSPHSKLRWTKLLEIGLNLTCFFLAWILISTYILITLKYIFPNIESITYHTTIPDDFFGTIFLYTLGTGTILYIVIHAYDILISHEKFLSNIEESQKDKKFKLPKTYSKDLFVIKGKNKREQLEIFHNQFLYAQSEGHYIKIFYFQEKKKTIKQYLIRNTILNLEKQLEQQLRNSQIIFRCHKSYLINLSHCNSFIESPSKNFVCLKYNKISLPVSNAKAAPLAIRLS